MNFKEKILSAQASRTELDLHIPGIGRVYTPLQPGPLREIWSQDGLIDKYGIEYDISRVTAPKGLFFLNNGLEHKVHKKVVTPHVVNTQAIPDIVSQTFGQEIDHWIYDSGGKLVDPFTHVEQATLRIISRSFFDYDPTANETAEVVAAIDDISRYLGSNLKSLFLVEKASSHIPQLKQPFFHGRDVLRSFAERIASQQSPFLKSLSSLEEKYNDHERVIDEIIVAFSAGHLTTSSTITWALLLLGQPENQDLQHEIRNELSVNKRTSPLLHASLQESMRLYPPIFATSRQVIQDIPSPKDLKKGNYVVMSPFLIHRNPKLWADPLQFNPARFLSGQEIAKDSYIPFGLGPRRCIGEKPAWMISELALATILDSTSIDSNSPASPTFQAILRPKASTSLTLTPLR